MTEDVTHTTMDAIVASTFGHDGSADVISAHMRFLFSVSRIQVPANGDYSVEFPAGPMPAIAAALITLTNSLEMTFKSPVPTLHHSILRQFHYMRKAKSIKENIIARQLQNASKRFTKGSASHQDTKCVMDKILRREIKAAAKEKRLPAYKSRAMYDEVSKPYMKLAM